MADFWKVNQVSTNGSIRYWDMIETMLEAGWTMPNAGDGFALPAAANKVTHGGTGAGGLGNTTAWVRMRDPGGGREIIIQRKSQDYYWDLVYSPSANFTGGSPSHTVRPTAADEKVVLTSGLIFESTPTTSIHHVWASDVSPYPFYLLVYLTVGGPFTHFTMMDEVEVHGTDTDNIVFIRGHSQGTIAGLADNTLAVTSGGLSAWGMSNGNLVNMTLYTVMSRDQYAGQRGFQMWNVPPIAGSTADLIGPAFFYRRLGQTDPVFKGKAKNFKLAGFERPSCGVTYTVSSTRDRIYWRGAGATGGGAVLPWNGDIPTYP